MRTLRPSIQKGFTLIELVVVLVILGILGAIAIPRYVDMTAAANAAAARAAVDSVSTAYTLALGSNVTTNPANPNPTVTQVFAGLQKATMAANNSGICAANGRLVPLWTGANYTGAVTAGTDVVASFGTFAAPHEGVADATNCP